GDYRSSLNLGNGFVLAYNGSAPGQGGSPNFFIAKYSPSGTVLWAKRGETTSGMAQTYANSVAVDESGNVYFAGSYSGNMLLGGTLLTKDSGWDRFYVAKLDSSGNLVWVKTSDPYLGNNGYGPVSISYAESVTVDKTGNVYTAGYYEGPLSIGGNPLLTKPNNTNYTFFAVKYNSTGEVIWVKSDTGSLGRGYDNSSMSNSISVDNIGNVYVSGQYFGDININGTVMPTQERFWNWSPFLTKFGTN
ncbi:MAG: SBBP repeat-containing protein, partial [Candidatus Diapherotrites archaeon]|nr:SBBP repeat-containing protein [Candidatus Diapherotrites archaeon]